MIGILSKRELKNIYGHKHKDLGGERPYNPLSMFKAIFLGQWFNLSDAALRQSLRVRLDFMAFCKFQLDQIPNRTTLCRFRNLLIKHKLHEKLFQII